MPWKPSDAPSHTKKANTEAKKKKWAKIANAALASCKAKGDKDCEGYAIRVANSAMGGLAMTIKNEKVPKGALCIVNPEKTSNLEFAEGEDKKPSLNMVLYSGKIIKNHWWWDDLAIDISGVKLSKSKLPLLEDHDTSRKLGFTTKVNLEDNTISIGPEGVTFVDTPTADEFVKLSKEGFPFEASLRGEPSVIQRLLEKEEAEVNGFTMKGPGTIWRKMALKEGSVCVFGYDSKTSASALSKEEVELEIDELVASQETTKLAEEIPNVRKEVKPMKRDELMEKHPELYAELIAEGKTEAETEFKDKKADWEGKLGEIQTQLTEKDTKILKLEKKEDQRSENDRKDQGDEMWDEKLSESTIPERLYPKVRKHVSFSDYVKDEVLNVEEFGKAIDNEIADWVKDGITDEVLGSSFTEKKPDDAELVADNADDEKRSDNLLVLAGRKVEKSAA